MWTAFCLFFFYHSQCLVVNSTDVASTWNCLLAYLWGSFQFELNEVRLFTLNMGETIPYAGVLGITVRKWAQHQPEFVFRFLTLCAMWWATCSCYRFPHRSGLSTQTVGCKPFLPLFPHVSDLATATIKISTTSFNLLYICSYLYRDYYRALNIFKIPCFLWYISIHLAN